MLNKLVDYVLRNILDKYVENFSSERVSLGYLKGDVTLKDLKLKSSAISDLLGFPFKIVKSNIGLVILRIPYTNIRNQPWIFSIENVDVLIEFNSEDINSSTFLEISTYEKIRESELLSLSHLENRWKNIVLNGGLLGAEVLAKSDDSWWSYGLSIVYGILRNLQQNHISQNQYNIKTLELDGFNVYTDSILNIDNPDSSDQIIIIPSSTKLKGHLIRRLISEPVSSLNEPARFEIRLSLDELQCTIPDQASQWLVASCMEISEYLFLRDRYRYRPTQPVKSNPKIWWRYAATQLVPSIKGPVVHSIRKKYNMQELFNEAKLSLQHVKLYKNYLYEIGQVKKTVELNNDNESVKGWCKLEENWSIERIKILRQVAMRLAAKHLYSIQKANVDTLPEQISDQSSSSWGIWWLYSKWYPSETKQVSSTDSSSDTVLSEDEEFSHLFDEMSETEDLGTILMQDKVFCRITGSVSIFSLTLAEHSYLSNSLNSILILRGEEFLIGFESRPRFNSFKMVAGLNTFTLLDRCSCDLNQMLFPKIISSTHKNSIMQKESPFIEHSEFAHSKLPSDSGGLFWLEYQFKPILSEGNYERNLDAQYYLRVRTDPLQIVFHPLLIQNVINFFKRVAKEVKKPAMARLEEVKARTRASLASALNRSETTSEKSQKRASKRELRWAVDLDIAAPKILIPDKFSLVKDGSVIGLLCDLGHLSFVNYGIRNMDIPEFVESSDEESDNEEFADAQEFFLCSDENIGMVPTLSNTCKINQSGTCLENFRKVYETYEMRLDNLRLLAGNLEVLVKLDYWVQPDFLHSITDIRKDESSFEKKRFASLASSKLFVVEQFSCVLHISRRLFSTDLLPKPWIQDPPSHKLPIDLPNLIVVWYQPTCVFMISENKVLAIKRCLDLPPMNVSEENDLFECENEKFSMNFIEEESTTLGEISQKNKLNTERTTDRRKIVASFRLDELIVQLDYGNRPIAECRLSKVSVGWARYRLGRSQARMVLHSLTIVDAIMVGSGGEYDLLAASHRSVYLDTLSGVLKVTQEPPDKNKCQKQASVNDLSLDQMKFMDPIEFSHNHNEDDSLIKILYNWNPVNSLDSKVVNQKIEFKFNYLDLVANPETFVELYQFFQTISIAFKQKKKSVKTQTSSNSSVPSIRPRSNSHSSHKITKSVVNNNKSDQPIIITDANISLEKLSLVIIDVFNESNKSSFVTTSPISLEPSPVSNRSVKKLTTATMSRISLNVHDGDVQLLFLNIAGVQILDLTATDGKPRYQLAAGDISLAEQPVSTFSSVANNPWLYLNLYREKISSKLWSSFNIEGGFNEFTYIHSPMAFNQLSSWIAKFPDRIQETASRNLRRGLKNAANRVVREMVEFSDSSLLWSSNQSFGKVKLELKSPVLVLPESNENLQRLLVFRFGDLYILNDEGDIFGISLELKQAQLSALDLAKFPNYCGNFDYFLSIFRKTELSDSESSARQFIIDNVSGKLKISKRNTVKRIDYLEEPIKMPDYFNSSHFIWPVTNEILPDDSQTTSLCKWFLAVGKIEQDVHIRLNKSVYDQLRNSIKSLTNEHYDATVLDEKSTDVENDELSLSLLDENVYLDSDFTLNDYGSNNHLFTSKPADNLCFGLYFQLPVLKVDFYEQTPNENNKNLFCISFSDFRLKITALNLEKFIDLSLGNLLMEDETVASDLSKRLLLSSYPYNSSHSNTFKSSEHFSQNFDKSRELVKIRTLLIDKNHLSLEENYSQTTKFLDIAFNSLTCRLNVESWLLIGRFLTVSDVHLTEDISYKDFSGIQSPKECSSSSHDDLQAFLSVIAITLIFTATEQSQNCEKSSQIDLALCRATELELSIKIPLVDLLDESDIMTLTGSLGAILLEDLTSEGSLYPQRFLTQISSEVDDQPEHLLEFSLTKKMNILTKESIFESLKSSQDDCMTNSEATLRIRLQPTYYVHSQRFLTALIDNLIGLNELYDLLTYLNESVINEDKRRISVINRYLQPQLSARILLDVYANAPLVVIPLSSCNPEVIVCDLGLLKASNHFSLLPRPAKDLDEVIPIHDICTAPICGFCEKISNFKAEAMHTFVSCRDVEDALEVLPTIFSKQGSPPNQVFNINEALIDNIEVKLTNMAIFAGYRYSKDKFSTKLLKDDPFRTTLFFPNFILRQRFKRLICDQFSLSIDIKRNLCTAFTLWPTISSWDVDLQLTKLHFVITKSDFRLIRGMLNHNLGEQCRVPESVLQMAIRNSIIPSGSLLKEPHKNSNSSETESIQLNMSIAFNLKDVQLDLCDEIDDDIVIPNSYYDQDVHSFTSLAFIYSQLSYQSFSSGHSSVKLVCRKINLIDCRFDGNFVKALNGTSLDNPESSRPSVFPFILTSELTSDQSNQYQLCIRYVSLPNTESGNSTLSFIELNSIHLTLVLELWLRFFTFISQPVPEKVDPLLIETSIRIPNKRVTEKKFNSLKLNVVVRKSNFTVIQDLTDRDSNAILIKTALCFNGILENNPTSDGFVFDNFTFQLHDAALSTCNLADERLSEVHVIDPCSVTACLIPGETRNRLERRVSQNKLEGFYEQSANPVDGLHDLVTPRCQLHVGTSTISGRFAYTDGLLFLDVLNSLHLQIQKALQAETERKETFRTQLNNENFSESFLHELNLTVAEFVEMGFDADQAREELLSTVTVNSKLDVNAALTNLSNPLKKGTEDLFLDREILLNALKSSSINQFQNNESWTVIQFDNLIKLLGPYISALYFSTNINLYFIDDCLDADIPLAQINFLGKIFNYTEMTLQDTTLNWDLNGFVPGKMISGLSITYYNRDLASWEPAIEPWRFELKWSLTNKHRFAQLMLTSRETMNFNLTIPLIQLARLIPEKIAKESEINKKTSRNGKKLSLNIRKRNAFVPFRMLNQTHETIWFRTSTSQLVEYIDNQERAENFEDINNWTEVPGSSNPKPVDLPFKTPNETCGRKVIGAPRLVIQVDGWRPTYPIAIDRLGLFFRTISRERRAAMNAQSFPLNDRLGLPLPSRTRLIIEVVRNGSAQNLVIVRSALTLTNNLGPGNTIEVGFEPFVPTSGSEFSKQTLSGFVGTSSLFSSDYYRHGASSESILDPSLTQPIISQEQLRRQPKSSSGKTVFFVDRVQSGKTISLPLKFAAFSSAKLGIFRFRPLISDIKSQKKSNLTVKKMAENSDDLTSSNLLGSFIEPVYSWSLVQAPKVMDFDVQLDNDNVTETKSSRKMPYIEDVSSGTDFERQVTILDWTKLKKPGEVLDCVLYNEPITDSRELGLLVASSMIQTKSATSTISNIRESSDRPLEKSYYMCLSCVRDVYPIEVFNNSMASQKNEKLSPRPLQLPGHHFTIGSPIKITNLLPCDLIFFFRGTDISGVVKPGKDAFVTEIGCAEILRIGIKLEGFMKCNCIDIQSKNFSYDLPMYLFDELGRQLEIKSKEFGPRHFTITAVCWIMNRSGLPLLYSHSLSQSSSTSVQTYLAAGQSNENEYARQLCPFLYSFPNKDESKYIYVRIGKGFTPTQSRRVGTQEKAENTVLLKAKKLEESKKSNAYISTWSPGVNLEKNGADTIQLKLASSSNRPGYVYNIGVEVRSGIGLHNKTTMVTFKPRFIIENRTPFKFEFAQQYCLSSDENESAILLAYPNASFPFHWPRQDLDQLLSLRACFMLENSNFKTEWSGGIPINETNAFHIMLRFPQNVSIYEYLHETLHSPHCLLFLHVAIILKEASFHIQIFDASKLPRPFQIRNQSSVSLNFQQLCNLSNPLNFQGVDIMNKDPHLASLQSDSNPDQSSSSNDNTLKWVGGATWSYLGPLSSVDYAPEEPIYAPKLLLGVQGGTSAIYDLSKLGPGEDLVYKNFVYLTLSCPFTDTNQYDPTITAHYRDNTQECYVLEVPRGSRRVTLAKKRPGDRIQLWYVTPSGHVFHEGSSPPHDPRDPPEKRFNKRSLVLDLYALPGSSTSTSQSPVNTSVLVNIDARTKSQFLLAALCITTYSKSRLKYQSWRLDLNGSLMNQDHFCVQVYRNLNYCINDSKTTSSAENLLLGSSVIAAKPKPKAIELISDTFAPAIFQLSWLRPGSGRLKVTLENEYGMGPTQILCIEDHDPYFESTSNSYNRWITNSRSNCSKISDNSPLSSSTPYINLHSRKIEMHAASSNETDNSDSIKDTQPSALQLVLNLPMGIGISMVTPFAEELLYASLLGIQWRLTRVYPAIVQFSLKSTPDHVDSQRTSGTNIHIREVHDESIDNSSNEAPSAEIWEIVNDQDSLPSLRSDSKDSLGSSFFSLFYNEIESSTHWQKPMETLVFSVKWIQIDSQYAGATLPILLYAAPPSSRLNNKYGSKIQQGTTIDLETTSNHGIKTKELGAAASANVSHPMGSKPVFSTILVIYEKQMQYNWDAAILNNLHIRVNKLIIQAEEILLLKLIQFFKNATREAALSSNYIFNVNECQMTDLKELINIHQNNKLLSLDPDPLASFGYVYVKNFSVRVASLRLTVQTAQHLIGPDLIDAKRLMPALMSFADADLRLKSFEVKNKLDSFSQFVTLLMAHYKMQLRTKALKIFGSVDFLGNPAGLFNDITMGISGLGEGDLGGLFRNVAHGVGDSTAKVFGSVSHLMSAMSLDERHQRQRALILNKVQHPDQVSFIPSNQTVTTNKTLTNSRANKINKQYALNSNINFQKESVDDFQITTGINTRSSQLALTSSSVSADNAAIMSFTPNGPWSQTSKSAPLSAGFKGLMHGFYGGVTSLASQTYYGVKEDHIKGLVYGAGKGLIGTFTKPIGGVLDLFSGVMTSVREVARSSYHGRPRKRRPRRSGLSIQHPMPAYNSYDAVAQLQIIRLLNAGINKPSPIAPKAVSISTKRSGNRKKSLVSDIIAKDEENLDKSQFDVDISDEEFSSSCSEYSVESALSASASNNQNKRMGNLLNLAGNIDTFGSSSRSNHSCPVSRLLSLTTGFDQVPMDSTDEISTTALASLGFSGNECTLVLLPSQISGIVVIVTDRSLWCIRDMPLVQEQKNVNLNLILSDRCEVLFILPYPRLDGIHLSKVSGEISDAPLNDDESWYITFVGDAGASSRVLRFDRFQWALQVVRLVGEAHFRFMQSAMSLNRRRLFVNVYTEQLLSHPLAMAHAPPQTNLMNQFFDPANETLH